MRWGKIVNADKLHGVFVNMTLVFTAETGGNFHKKCKL
jgi:hypothetical protein